jgi:HSP20 family protein
MLTRSRLSRDPFAAMTRDMDRLFESMFSSAVRATPTDQQSRWFSAPMNLWEDDSNVYVEMELPGVKLENIEILATGDELSIKGTREIQLPEEARWLRRERGAGSFERKTTLPSDVNVDDVQATLINGVLTVTLPKAEHRRPRKVAVKALPTHG